MCKTEHESVWDWEWICTKNASSNAYKCVKLSMYCTVSVSVKLHVQVQVCKTEQSVWDRKSIPKMQVQMQLHAGFPHYFTSSSGICLRTSQQEWVNPDHISVDAESGTGVQPLTSHFQQSKPAWSSAYQIFSEVRYTHPSWKSHFNTHSSTQFKGRFTSTTMIV